MADDEVAALRRDFNDLRTEVHAWGSKIDTIHTAVLGFAGRTYVPGPSIWKRLLGWIGLVKLG
jgi:hypothetical protein